MIVVWQIFINLLLKVIPISLYDVFLDFLVIRECAGLILGVVLLA